MLQVTEHGVTITLNGKSTTDLLFWLTLALIVLAIGVALAMIFLPMKLAIACLVLLVVFSFVFNRYKQRLTGAKSAMLISDGVINVQQGMIVHNVLGKQQRIMVLNDDKIKNSDSALIVYNAKQQTKCHISGFDNDKEIEVMTKILQGQNINKRNANIKIKES